MSYLHHPFVLEEISFSDFDFARLFQIIEEPYWNWWNIFAVEINKALSLIGL